MCLRVYGDVMFRTVSRRNIPNALTVARILMTPLLLVLLVTPTFWARLGAVLLFVLASASDYLDGVLARRMEAHSQVGKFLDPMADKILVLGTFVTLAVIEPRVVPWWAVLLIGLRDALVTGLRSWAAARGHALRTLPAAKWKTLVQLLFLFLMLVLLTLTHGSAPETPRWLLNHTMLPFGLLMVVVGFTIYTGALYVMQAQAIRWRQTHPTNHSQ